MSDLVVIYNELSRFGLRCVHLMRMGGPVDVDEARGQYIEALASYHKARAEVERLTGGRLEDIRTRTDLKKTGDQ